MKPLTWLAGLVLAGVMLPVLVLLWGSLLFFKLLNSILRDA